MLLEIITPEKLLFKEEVDMVRVPGTNGSFAMLPKHIPIVSTLEPGTIKILHEGIERFFQTCDNAIVEQHGNVVTILASHIEETYPIIVR